MLSCTCGISYFIRLPFNFDICSCPTVDPIDQTFHRTSMGWAQSIWIISSSCLYISVLYAHVGRVHSLHHVLLFLYVLQHSNIYKLLDQHAGNKTCKYYHTALNMDSMSVRSNVIINNGSFDDLHVVCVISEYV